MLSAAPILKFKGDNMYPKDIIFGLDLYDIFLCIGILTCIFVFDRLATRYPLKNKLQILALYDGIISIICGYGSAVLFQAVYNIAVTGKFEITKGTGATFYGGLIGGAVTFLLIYFIIGHIYFKDKYHIVNFFPLTDCIVPGIVIAHSLGRIGCLFAGCCHGSVTDAWYGIYMHGNYGYTKYVPIQLFEAIFLALLFVFLCVRSYKKYSYSLPIYMISYGTWRYFIEFFRADERGGIFTEALTPSQFIAVLMVIGGVFLFFFEKYYLNKHSEEIASLADEVLKKRKDESHEDGKAEEN